MKLFVSWSRPLSKQHALCFRDWIGKVFQSVEPFMSDQDISLGAKGIPAIEAELDQIDFGVIFVTSENRDAPWIHYEAGALSRTVELPEARVIPVLIDIEIADLGASPLSGFQGCKASRDGVKRICNSINDALPKRLGDSDLKETFETWWPKLEECWSKLDSYRSTETVAVTLDTLDDRLKELTKLVVSLRGSERDQTNMLLSVLLERENPSSSQNALSSLIYEDAKSDYSKIFEFRKRLLHLDKSNRLRTKMNEDEGGEISDSKRNE